MTICPRDNQEMVKISVASVEVDECPQCRGLWFRGRELELAKDQTDRDLAWLDLDVWKDAERIRTEPGALACPVCESGMAAVQYGTTGVAVDVCPVGHGIWLDQGEFPRIIEALTEQVTGTSAGDYLKASLHEAGELFTSPESFASEWRDLRAVLRLLYLRFFMEHPGLTNITSSTPVIG